jgi:hypothetical protein
MRADGRGDELDGGRCADNGSGTISNSGCSSTNGNADGRTYTGGGF